MKIHSERKKRLSLSLLFKIIKDTVWGFIDDSVMRLSASLAYATLFSIIPFLSLLVTVGVFFHMDLANQLYVQLQPIVGPEVTEALRSIIENAENTDFSWESSNPDVLRVYWNQIRGLKEGTSEVIIKTPEGITEKRIKVNVIKIPVEQIIPEEEEYTIGVNEVIDINYSYLPENATNIDFSWTASDTSVLNVYWNKVRGLQEGKAYIIIKTPDGSLEKRIKIIVEEQ